MREKPNEDMGFRRGKRMPISGGEAAPHFCRGRRMNRIVSFVSVDEQQPAKTFSVKTLHDKFQS
jgi:hypothetical protein